jgi:ferritin-like metal-binding protein YciE
MPDKMQSIQDLMLNGLTYVLDFENQVSQEAQKMAQASSDPEAKQFFEQSATKGKEYAQRIKEVFQKLGQQAETKDNQIAKAMITEVEQMIQSTDQSPVRDAALIVAANQMQLYRVAVYGSLAHYAELIGKQDAVQPLNQNLEDSKGGDAKITKIGEQNVNKKAVSAAA